MTERFTVLSEDSYEVSVDLNDGCVRLTVEPDRLSVQHPPKEDTMAWLDPGNARAVAHALLEAARWAEGGDLDAIAGARERLVASGVTGPSRTYHDEARSEPDDS
jgi:hypothetical protein